MTTGAGVAPVLRARVMTDHRISQLSWWSEVLTILRPPVGRGPFASFDAAVRAVWNGSKFDAFISANVRNALALGLFKRCALRSRPALVMTEMRLDDPRPGLRWRVKLALQRFAYAAVDACCVSSRREAAIYAERLRLPIARFHFVPWHTNVLQPTFHPPAGAYVLAAGRTGRDWATLAAAVVDAPVSVTVVCSKADADRQSFPPNVAVLTDVPYERYRSLLNGAAAVVIPLEEHTFSSGQVVILEAMALGKPVVAARVLGSEDYIEHGVDGLLVPPGDPVALRSAIQRITEDSEFAERLGRGG